MNKLSTFLLAGTTFSFAALSCSSEAAVNLDRTRVIFDATKDTTSVTLENENHDRPYLAQAWIENSAGIKSNDALIALPPLQRLDPMQKTQVKITKVAGSAKLPTDRESLFYFNVREIPPKGNKQNVMKVAIQSRIKLFYRPANLAVKSLDLAANTLTVTKIGGTVKLDNPSPYHITVLYIKNVGGTALKSVDGELLLPFANKTVTGAGGLGSEFLVSYINDFGGVSVMKFGCTGNACRSKEGS